MTGRPWTLLQRHEKAELWRQDRLDPGGNPVAIFHGSTFMEIGGQRRQTPERPTFSSQAEGEAWFGRVIATEN